MSLVDRVLDVARAEIGYSAAADPKRGSRYGRWCAKYSGQAWLADTYLNVAYCNMFVSWVFHQAGAGPAINVDNGHVYAYTVAHANWFSRHNRRVSVHDAKPGDVVFFDWRYGGDRVEHVGIVEKNLGSGTLQTIEGNTTGGVGNQARGGHVMRKIRTKGIAEVYRPIWERCKEEEPIKEDNMFVVVVDNRDLYLVQDGMEVHHLTPNEWNAYQSLGLRQAHISRGQLQTLIASQKRMTRILANEVRNTLLEYKNPRCDGGDKDLYHHIRNASAYARKQGTVVN